MGLSSDQFVTSAFSNAPPHNLVNESVGSEFHAPTELPVQMPNRRAKKGGWAAGGQGLWTFWGTEYSRAASKGHQSKFRSRAEGFCFLVVSATQGS